MAWPQGGDYGVYVNSIWGLEIRPGLSVSVVQIPVFHYTVIVERLFLFFLVGVGVGGCTFVRGQYAPTLNITRAPAPRIPIPNLSLLCQCRRSDHTGLLSMLVQGASSYFWIQDVVMLGLIFLRILVIPFMTCFAVVVVA